MAFTVTQLASAGSDTDGTVYTVVPSRAIGANKLGILAFCSRRNSATADDPTVSSISGQGLTWQLIGAVSCSATFKRRLFFYRGLVASPSAGNITITMGETQRAMEWAYYEVDGIDTSGTHGSGAIGVTGLAVSDGMTSGSTITVTLAAFASATNMTFVGTGGADEITNTAFEGGYTEERDAGNLDSDMAIGHLSAEDNSVVSTVTLSTTNDVCSFAFEIKAAAAAGGAVFYSGLSLMGVGSG